MLCSIRGKPLKGLVFFPLIRFEPARAGIMTNILLEELIIYKAIIFFRKNIIRYLHEIIALKG
jgi:hypothetical protein